MKVIERTPELIDAAPELAHALLLVASKTVLTSGVRAVVDAALAKAGVCAPEPEVLRTIRCCGEEL